MANTESKDKQKIKLLKLYDLLKEETDKDHPISRIDLCKRLNEMGISSNVRTLSLDIAVLNSNGYKVESFLRKNERYFYISNSDFSIAELRILIDAVKAATFITPEKSEELIDKVCALGGKKHGDSLKKNTVKFNTKKHSNEDIYETIDILIKAIENQNKVTYNYFDLDVDKSRNLRKDDNGNVKEYVISPVDIIFNDDNYYLIGVSDNHPMSTSNYRIDRITNIKELPDVEILKYAKDTRMKIADSNEIVFNMFEGEPKKVTLEFDKSILGAVYDEFGENKRIECKEDGLCRMVAWIKISPTFFGWVAQFSDKMRIVEPENIIKKYNKHILGK